LDLQQFQAALHEVVIAYNWEALAPFGSSYYTAAMSALLLMVLLTLLLLVLPGIPRILGERFFSSALIHLHSSPTVPHGS
jgi:hypothetical protein